MKYSANGIWPSLVGEADQRTRRWGIAWICLVLALAIHVADEAMTDFLPLYNSVVQSIRADFPWIPLPTFTFPVWLGGLILAVTILLSLSLLVFRGRAWLRALSVAFGALMVANALGHISASVYWGMWAPGVYPSPILLAAAISLLVTVHGARCDSESSTRI